MTRLGGLVAVAAALAVLAGCGSSGGEGAEPTTTSVPTAPGGEPAGEGEPAVPAAVAGFESEVYADDVYWLCRPDIDSPVCTDDLDVTHIAADGTTEVEEVEPATAAPLDCFYVYPTVNMVGEGTNDLAMADDVVAETVITRLQAAPFSSLCNVYVPLYRQLLMSGFQSPDVAAGMEMAYADVRDAYFHYLANWNEGRPVVLIGHSQGSGHLATLLAEEIEGDEEMRSLVELALLIGGQVTVPQGEDTGGTFDELPLCRSDDQRGCVVAYNSIAVTQPPPEDSMWTRAEPGLVRACTNPAALGGGAAPLQSQVGTTGSTWTVEGVDAEVDTAYVAFDGAVSGECVERDGRAWFEIAAATEPADARNVATLTQGTDFWALHTVDVNLALGDLLALVRTHAEAL